MYKILYLALLCLFVNESVLAQDSSRKHTMDAEIFDQYVKKSREGQWTSKEVNYRPDSISVKFPASQSVVSFAFTSYILSSGTVPRFGEYLGSMLKEIAQSVDTSIPQTGEVHIWINGQRFYNLRDSKPETLMSSERGEKAAKFSIYGVDDYMLPKVPTKITALYPPGWKLEIHYGGVIAHVYAPTFAQLESLSKENFKLVSDSISEFTKEKLRRHSLGGSMIVQDNKVVFSDLYRKVAGDEIALHLNGAVGFVNNNFYPEMEFSVSLNFRNRYHIQENKVTFGINRMFFPGFDADGRMKSASNSFLNLSYCRKIGFYATENYWFGPSFGIMINEKGGFFQGNTVKVGINAILERFTLTPELYFTNGYKNSVGGFRVGYAF